MPKTSISAQHHTTFEGIRQIDDAGNEFWSARKLSKVLEYSEYRHFLPVIGKAREACQNSRHSVTNHFEDVLDMVEIGSGAQRKVGDVRLSRYACYLIVQNGDPAKPVIANGQTYFALQTRRQELEDSARFAQLSEDEKRLAIRNELAAHNKHLAAAAKGAGVETALDCQNFRVSRLNWLVCLISGIQVCHQIGCGNKRLQAAAPRSSSQWLRCLAPSVQTAAPLSPLGVCVNQGCFGHTTPLWSWAGRLPAEAPGWRAVWQAAPCVAALVLRYRTGQSLWHSSPGLAGDHCKWWSGG